MNFVRATIVQGKKIAPEKRIYAILAVCGEALINAALFMLAVVSTGDSTPVAIVRYSHGR
jgi:hypothetical protein